MTNFEKIIIFLVSLLIIAVLIIGAIVFRQQKTINTLVGSTIGTSNQSAVQTPARKSGPSLTEVIKQFSGTIESISGNQLSVGAKLPDYSKPKNPDKFKNREVPITATDDDFEVIEKKITVNTNEKTVFNKKPLAELKVGDAVSVISDKSPYSSDTVTAVKITSVELPK